MTQYLKPAVVLLAACLLSACTTEPDTDASPSVAISADGSPVNYAQAGSGDLTLVFVHCWTCDHSFWDAQFEHFAKHYRVVRLDLAAHGDSGSKRQRYTMQAFGQDVAAVVDAVGAGRTVLIGHSMGGPVSLEAARILGDRVVGIVGVDTFYTPFVYPTSEEAIEDFATPFKTDFRATTQNMLASMFTPNADPATREAIVAKFNDSDETMAVSALYEIFYWNAEHGDAARAQFAARLYNINAAPTGEEQPLHESVVMVPNVGHFIPQVAPQAFNRALETILSQLDAP